MSLHCRRATCSGSWHSGQRCSVPKHTLWVTAGGARDTRFVLPWDLLVPNVHLYFFIIREKQKLSETSLKMQITLRLKYLNQKRVRCQNIFGILLVNRWQCPLCLFITVCTDPVLPRGGHLSGGDPLQSCFPCALSPSLVTKLIFPPNSNKGEHRTSVDLNKPHNFFVN